MSRAAPAGPRNTAPYAPNPQNAPPSRDRFPLLLGSTIGIVVLGLLVVAFLVATNRNSAGVAATPTAGSLPAAVPSAPAGVTPAVPNAVPSAANGSPIAPAAVPTGGAANGTPNADAPRMPLEEFKKLYDDPAKRPLIIDVRSKASYDAGHIKGAISFPFTDVKERESELPKDKLVVAYCQ